MSAALDATRPPTYAATPPLRSFMRAVGAVVMREIITRYGRDNIGFVWLILEPIIFTLGVIAFRAVISPYYGGGFAHGLSLVTFLLTGYMPFLVFRHLASASLHCLRRNAALLYHRRIGVLELYTARFIVEIAGVLLGFWTSVIGFSFFEVIRPPDDPLLVHLGWMYCAWFSIAFAMILGALSEFSRIVERIWQPFGYLAIIASGVFYMAEWIPSAYRETVLHFNPMLHFFELIRDGYYDDTVRTHYDLGYLSLVCGVMTLIGLLLAPIARRRFQVE